MGGRHMECTYLGCQNKKTMIDKLFFKYPHTDPLVCEKWVNNSGNPDIIDLWRTNPKGIQYRYVCEDHFNPKQICRGIGRLNKSRFPGAGPVPNPVNMMESVRKLQMENQVMKLQLNETRQKMLEYRKIAIHGDAVKERVCQRILQQIVDHFDNITLLQLEMIKVILCDCVGEWPTGGHYTERFKLFCYALFQSDQRAYNLLVREFPLPTVPCLRHWAKRRGVTHHGDLQLSRLESIKEGERLLEQLAQENNAQAQSQAQDQTQPQPQPQPQPHITRSSATTRKRARMEQSSPAASTSAEAAAALQALFNDITSGEVAPQ